MYDRLGLRRRAAFVSMDRIRAIMMRAWARLNPAQARQRTHPPYAGRQRDVGAPVPTEDAASLGKPGFAEEALPWMDAVHRFALRLTKDASDAEDLVQETYLRAFRSWDQFALGSNCRAWLFTICRNTYMHERERASTRYEVAESALPASDDVAGVSLVAQRAVASGSPDDFFEQIVDGVLLDAIDTLPDAFRETLILSDLADLEYAEIAEVLDVPIGTVKSRLFRARRQLKETLLAYGSDSAHAAFRSAPDRGRDAAV